jgi:hypothetical protein
MKNLPVQGSEVEDGGLLWIPLFLLSFSFPLILSFLLLSLCAIFFGLYFCFLSVSLCVWLSLCVLSPFRFCVLFVRPSVFFFFFDPVLFSVGLISKPGFLCVSPLSLFLFFFWFSVLVSTVIFSWNALFLVQLLLKVELWSCC